MKTEEFKPRSAGESVEGEESGGMLKILSTPWFGIAGTLSSIAGFLLAFYFYYASKETIDLTYLINPLRTTVVKGVQNSRISATFDGQKIAGDVSAVQVLIWNRGKRSIRTGNILKPVRVSIANAKILEATVARTTRDVISPNITQEATNYVHLSWTILEKNDGFIVQIIYAGGIEQPLTIEATIEGQESLSVVKQEISSEKKNTLEKEPYISVITLFLTLLLLGLSTSIRRTVRISDRYFYKLLEHPRQGQILAHELRKSVDIPTKRNKSSKIINVISIIMVIVSLILMVASIYNLIASSHSTPPIDL